MPGHGIILYEDIPISGLPINVPGGVCGLDGLAHVAPAQLANAVLTTEVGVAGGVASLDGSVKVPAAQLPGSFLTLQGIALTTGNVGVGGLATIPGTLISFTVGVAGDVKTSISGYWSGSTALPSVVLGVRFDGVTDAILAADARVNGSGGDTDFSISQSGIITVPLAAGPHTVEIIAAQGGFPGFVLVASPGNPLCISVLYP